MKNSKFGNTLGSIGLLGGIFYAMGKQKSLGQTAIYALLFGVGGIIIGNSITIFTNKITNFVVCKKV
jgi:xanthosine utilization system XapX-like protein